ncbi:galanin peptides isoform x1 [Limosa lapponica baueri]|uniref:Galanin peptides n=1 Tax=Limosa lapponica baueri TaxID=1758121 RepID=A0A2I0ULF3_LIMLA|nr:galanin peptides isoform x1 [Limosa lapponica baueri]
MALKPSSSLAYEENCWCSGSPGIAMRLQHINPHQESLWFSLASLGYEAYVIVLASKLSLIDLNLLANFNQMGQMHYSPMQRCTGFLFLSLILCATLSETFGLVFSAKEKRGWTLNSAGYLLGPRRIDQLLLIKEMPIARGREEAPGAYAVDNHRSFNDKHGFTGKREIQPDEDIKAGNLGRPLADENIVRTVLEFLTYLHLKEVGALDKLPSPEETNQS